MIVALPGLFSYLFLYDVSAYSKLNRLKPKEMRLDSEMNDT